MEASITLKKVGKLIDDKTIVAGLTFGIERGSLVAIIGANDTGKSILLRLLSGYEKPDYGNIFIHGLDMQKRKSKTRQLIGFVPHETDLDPWLTIEQNIQPLVSPPEHGHKSMPTIEQHIQPLASPNKARTQIPVSD